MRQSPDVAELSFFFTAGATFYSIMPVLLTMRAIFLVTFGHTRTRPTSTYAARALSNCHFTYAATPMSKPPSRHITRSFLFTLEGGVLFVFLCFFCFLSRLCRQLVVRFVRVLPSSNTNLSFLFFLPMPKKKLRTTNYTEVQR